jgi:hypothetical protein
MEQDLVNLFGYAADNWLICFAILSVALNAHIPRVRSVILIVTLCSIVGHYISPIVFSMEGAWGFWGLFGASVAFTKLMFIVLLVHFNGLYSSKLVELLCFIFILQVGFHGLRHLDWAVLETEVLSIPLFAIELFGKSIPYDAYKLVVQALNVAALLSIYGNWLLKLVNCGENNGKYQSDSDSNTFHARLRSI